MHLGGDLRLGQPRDTQAITHILRHAHMRVERVVLEDHGNVAIHRLKIVGTLPADAQLALGDRLQPGHHAQEGGLAAARGADDDDEFAILNVDAHALDHLGGAKAFLDIVQLYSCHVAYFSLSTRPRIKSFCIEMTTTTGGIIARIEVAMITGQSATSSPDGNICLMPITMVFIDGSVVISSGQRYWFQP